MSESDGADTVTPLDGDGRNVVGLDEQFENVSADEYETRGQTTVATRRGYRFVPSDKEIPIITSDGVKMGKEDADKVVAESRGRVFIVEPKNEED